MQGEIYVRDLFMSVYCVDDKIEEQRFHTSNLPNLAIGTNLIVSCLYVSYVIVLTYLTC